MVPWRFFLKSWINIGIRNLLYWKEIFLTVTNRRVRLVKTATIISFIKSSNYKLNEQLPYYNLFMNNKKLFNYNQLYSLTTLRLRIKSHLILQPSTYTYISISTAKYCILYIYICIVAYALSPPFCYQGTCLYISCISHGPLATCCRQLHCLA